MRSYLVPDVFVVMPDHVHLLFGIRLHDAIFAPDRRRDTPPVCPYPDARTLGGAQAHSVSSIMRQYKSIVTKRIRQLDPTVRVWQSWLHDRVVRNPKEADALRAYIRDNPARWRPSSCLSP